ncbi:MAG: GIY-YIG nuclease family protein [Candidatus Omnitrophica bacterium]|nr:GIY-YIG nuclease family protein [Candidatus Omnitrophota bacterium]
MYYVYVLQSKKDRLFYTGFTKSLNRRIEEHNNKCQIATKNRIPLELVYYEWCLNKEDAIAREKYLKSGIGKKYIKNRIRCYLEANGDCNGACPVINSEH